MIGSFMTWGKADALHGMYSYLFFGVFLLSPLQSVFSGLILPIPQNSFGLVGYGRPGAENQGKYKHLDKLSIEIEEPERRTLWKAGGRGCVEPLYEGRRIQPGAFVRRTSDTAGRTDRRPDRRWRA